MLKRRKKLYAALEKNKNLTAFEKSIYQATLSIPRGQTRSYKWVAEKARYPRAYRAVGRALNKNPYAGRVPCHRVIKSDGSIGGFSKGVRAKKRLLKSEGLDAG